MFVEVIGRADGKTVAKPCSLTDTFDNCQLCNHLLYCAGRRERRLNSAHSLNLAQFGGTVATMIEIELDNQNKTLVALV